VATPTTAPAPTAGAASAVTPASGVAASPTAVRPKLGGAITTMFTTAQSTLEVHGASGGVAIGIGAAICYSDLLTYKFGPDIKPPSYIPTGDLAESWTQPDELTYVFKLRPGVKWHNVAPVNGRELVAEDVIYSYERVRAKRTLAGFLAGITRMEPVDKQTLRFSLDKPNADLLDNLAQASLLIVARERDEQTGGNLSERPLIGTGPFILESFEPGQRTVAKRNPDYFLRGQPYFDSFTGIQVTADPSLMASSFRAGATNALMSGLSHPMAEDIKRAVPTAYSAWIPADRIPTDLMLNLAYEPFRDVRVRQAIHKAIDRKAIMDTIWQGRARPMAGISLPDPSYGLPEAELNRLTSRDLEGARRLLREAGVSSLNFEIGATTVLSGAMVTIAELMQANLREIGITTTIKPLDSGAATSVLQSGNFQAFSYVTSAGAPNGWLNLRHYTGGGQNYSKYSDAEMDKLVDQQAVMVRDPEGRKKILQDIQRKIIDAAVYIPIAFFEQPHILAPEIRGFFPPTLPAIHNTFWTTIWLDK
jgi:peptide/nickel transport system substrate-binding protein